MKNGLWSADQDAALTEMWRAGLPESKMAEKLDRTAWSVRARRRRLGLVFTSVNIPAGAPKEPKITVIQEPARADWFDASDEKACNLHLADLLREHGVRL